MRFDRLITLGLVKPIGRVLGRFPAFDATPFPAKLTLPVLMYHSISNDPEPAFSPYYKICTSPKRFAEHMEWLAAAGWCGVTLSDGLDWLAGKKEIASRPVAITFDDGFRDFQTEAFPTLRRHGFSATMYLPTSYIGDERQSFKGRECLVWREVQELQEIGVEFGSHTVNHPALVQLDWPEIELELHRSKTILEQKLKRRVRTFAYPFAFPQENHEFTTRLAAILRQLSYESCTTTILGRIFAKDDPYTLKRLPANSCDDLPLLAAKAVGAYDWLGILQAIFRRIRHRRKSARVH